MVNKPHASLLADEVGTRSFLDRRSRAREKRHHALGRRAQLPGAQLPARRHLARRRRALLSLQRRPAGRRRHGARGPRRLPRPDPVRSQGQPLRSRQSRATPRAGSPSTSRSTRSSPGRSRSPSCAPTRRSRRWSSCAGGAASRCSRWRRASGSESSSSARANDRGGARRRAPRRHRRPRSRARLEAFYTGVLGLPILRRWPVAGDEKRDRSIWLDLGAGAFLALERADAEVVRAGAPSDRAHGLPHDRPAHHPARRVPTGRRAWPQPASLSSTARPTRSTSPTRRGTGSASRTGRTRRKIRRRRYRK